MPTRKPIETSLFLATLLVTFALHVHAEEFQGSPVSVRGLVVSSGHGLIINNGVQDFILLGVDNPDYEGKICEAFGEVGSLEDMPAIKVRTIKVIADEYPDEDLVGENRGFGSPCPGRCSNGIQGDAMVSPGIAMPLLRSLSLHKRGMSGMWLSGQSPTALSIAACRSHYTDTIEERQWT